MVNLDMTFSQSRSNDFRARFINEANCQLATPFDMTKANYDYQIG